MELTDSDFEYLKSKYLISHVNHFILQTSNFLERLFIDCEDRLVYFNRKMHQLESKITLLETNIGKLSMSLHIIKIMFKTNTYLYLYSVFKNYKDFLHLFIIIHILFKTHEVSLYIYIKRTHF